MHVIIQVIAHEGQGPRALAIANAGGSLLQALFGEKGSPGYHPNPGAHYGRHERKGALMAQSKGGKQSANPGGEWEEIQPFTQPITLEVGEEIIAQYLGGNEVEVPAKKGEDGAVEKDGKYVRSAMLHEFQNEGETEPFGVWGSAVLDKRLAEIPSGSRVRVLYDGKQELDGGRTARRYRVWVDRSAKF